MKMKHNTCKNLWDEEKAVLREKVKHTLRKKKALKSITYPSTLRNKSKLKPKEAEGKK